MFDTVLRALVACIVVIGAGCASEPRLAAPLPERTKLVLVLVGGNSEAVHDGGIWALYKGRAAADGELLLGSLRAATGLDRTQIATYYFSWTGDDEDARTSVLPGHWNWVFGGAARIEASLARVLDARPASTQLAIVGWSNGGATAYELACRMAATRRANLLVTLDPVAWTTSPCAAGKPAPWIDVYTASGPASRLGAGNVIALFGRAWDSDKLPSPPSELFILSPADHGDTKEMWTQRVVTSATYRMWASSFAR